LKRFQDALASHCSYRTNWRCEEKALPQGRLGLSPQLPVTQLPRGVGERSSGRRETEEKQALRRISRKHSNVGDSVRWRSWVHSAVELQRMDGNSGVAGLSGVPARTGRRGEDTEAAGACPILFTGGLNAAGCGRRLHYVHDARGWEIRHLPCSVYRATGLWRCIACGARNTARQRFASEL